VTVDLSAGVGVSSSEWAATKAGASKARRSAAITEATSRRGDGYGMTVSLSTGHAPRMSVFRGREVARTGPATGRDGGGTIVGNEPRPLAAQP